MLAPRQPLGYCRPRNWRGLLAVLIAAVYLLAGALHGLHDIDVTTPTGGSEIAAVLDSSGHTDHKALGGHHCHGCFSVTVAQPMSRPPILRSRSDRRRFSSRAGKESRSTSS